MVRAVAPRAKNLQHLLDKIFYVCRAGPDIGDGANPFAGAQVVVDGAEKAIFAAAINPRSADDITSSTSVAYRLLARDLFFAVYVDRPRLVLDRVWRPADGLAVKGILGAEVNDLRVQLAGRCGEQSRSIYVDRLQLWEDFALPRRPVSPHN